MASGRAGSFTQPDGKEPNWGPTKIGGCLKVYRLEQRLGKQDSVRSKIQ